LESLGKGISISNGVLPMFLAFLEI
jgi:hypothetical protein